MSRTKYLQTYLPPDVTDVFSPVVLCWGPSPTLAQGFDPFRALQRFFQPVMDIFRSLDPTHHVQSRKTLEDFVNCHRLVTQRKSFREENIRDFDRLETNPGSEGFECHHRQTGLVKCPETSIHLYCHSWRLQDTDTRFLLKCFNHFNP